MVQIMMKMISKGLKWLLLLTLPLTIFPIFTGTLGGVLFPVFLERHISSATEKWLHDVQDAMSDWGVGGDVPSFREFQDENNGFHLKRVNTNDWISKLGFTQPIEYSDPNAMITHNIPIDKYASLDTLIRETGCQTADELPREQWLLLTRFEWLDFDGWNAAFDSVLRHAYTNPALNSSGFHFAECSATASFLCGVWGTRAPALLHFLVENEPLGEEDIDPNLSYRLPHKSFLPVTVRIIELGLQEAYTGLPWTTFPSKEKQLRSIMAGDRMYEQFEPFKSPDRLLLVRFNEYMDSLFDAKGTLLCYFNDLDWWVVGNIVRPLGIGEVKHFVHSICFKSVLITSMLVNGLMVRPVRYLVNAFLGTPKPGDVMFADWEEDDEYEDSDPFGFREMLLIMTEEIEKASSEAGRTAAAGTSDPPGTASHTGKF